MQQEILVSLKCSTSLNLNYSDLIRFCLQAEIALEINFLSL